ncbi:hypothetical protein PROFUN_13365 [Planoprotostelium fungivorum]|uniref:V-SNARE coiled-coil homology domain-containing protein n=1 Tax=Planoprotostelium fungivorum TaxID=1890364 RepID=A0A2P6N456_9EUKA|nr:hypothetical protein PROFUN_13365 [Planoprotostelium fungivorum]
MSQWADNRHSTQQAHMDIFRTGNKTNTPAAPPKSKTTLVFEQIEEVKALMGTNIQKVIDNIDKASILEQKTADLLVSSQQFKTASTKLKRQMWWKSVKLQLAIGTVVLIVVGTIIVPRLGSIQMTRVELHTIFSWTCQMIHISPTKIGS